MRSFLRTVHLLALLVAFVCLSAPRAGAAVISVGTFPELAPAPSIAIPAGAFLVSIVVTGADSLETWQFDVLFDPAVVELVDPADGSSGIYGAEFVPGDATSLSFILGGFPFNDLGLVDDVAGSYPFSFGGQTGDGVLAYLLFQFRPGQEHSDPNFTIPDTPSSVPEPGTLALVATALLVRTLRRRHLRTRTAVGHPSQETR